MKFSAIKSVVLFTLACLLSGCGTLGSTLYDSGVKGQEYNETKKQMLPYKQTVILAKSIYGNYSYITDEGRLFLFVAGVDSFDKDNVGESMRPLVDFLRWAKVTGPDQEKQRLSYNLQPLMRQRHIEYRYFPDGSPAFVDTYDRDNLSIFLKSLIDSSVKYYNYGQVLELVSIAYSVTHPGLKNEPVKKSD